MLESVELIVLFPSVSCFDSFVTHTSHKEPPLSTVLLQKLSDVEQSHV